MSTLSVFESTGKLIETFASGYDTIEAVKSFTLPISRKIDSATLLGDLTVKDSEDVVGHHLKTSVENIVNSIGDVFAQVVNNNFPVDKKRREILTHRAALDYEEIENELVSEQIIIQPDRTINDFKMQLALQAAKKKQKEEKDGSDTDSEAEVFNKRALDDIKLRYETEYVNQHDNYVNQTLAKNLATQNMRRIRREKMRLTVEDTILTAFLDSILHIVFKLKVSISKHPMIQKQLSTTTTIVSTGEDLMNPYESQNLSGIMSTLTARYGKNTFSNYPTVLTTTIGWRATDGRSDSQSFGEVESIAGEWKKFEYFKLMTEDYFFSAVFLKGMQSSPFRKELITETMKFIRKQNESDLLNDDMSNSSQYQESTMPIFKFIKQYVETERENKLFAIQNGEVKSTSTSGLTGSGNNGSNQVKGFNPNWNKKNNNSETAAVAVVGSTSESALAATSNSSSVSAAVVPKKLYSTEITKIQNIPVTDSKTLKVHSYVAVIKKSQICSKCYPDSGNPTSPCGRLCFAAQCNKCGFFGHKGYHCMQSHTVGGDIIQQ